MISRIFHWWVPNLWTMDLPSQLGKLPIYVFTLFRATAIRIISQHLVTGDAVLQYAWYPGESSLKPCAVTSSCKKATVGQGSGSVMLVFWVMNGLLTGTHRMARRVGRDAEVKQSLVAWSSGKINAFCLCGEHLYNILRPSLDTFGKTLGPFWTGAVFWLQLPLTNRAAASPLGDLPRARIQVVGAWLGMVLFSKLRRNCSVYTVVYLKFTRSLLEIYVLS